MAKNGKANGERKAGGDAADERTNGAAHGEGTNGAGEPRAAAREKPAEEAEAKAPEQASEAKGGLPAAAPAARGATWADPIARFDERWTWLESRLITFVLLSQIFALCAWVFLNGLTESVADVAGVVFRALLFAIVLGGGAYFATRRMPEERRTGATLVGIGLSIALAFLWNRVAKGSGPRTGLDGSVVRYFDNIKGWLQEGSTLTLLGGLRGLATRLTLWLALLGGSLATGAGKHIHIDVIFRFLPARARRPAAIFNYLVAAAVCFAAVWGFFDHLAIESYGSKAEDRPGAKVSRAMHEIGDHAFYTRKQVGLDLRSLPHVLKGERYDTWMSGAAWNEWVDGAGFDERFGADKAKNIKVQDPAQAHPPLVVSPSGETTRGALAHTLSLVFPFGLLAIALRFLLRALLTLSGHLSADPNEAHKEEIGHGGAGEAEKAAEGGA